MDIPMSAPSLPEDPDRKANMASAPVADSEILRELCTVNGVSYDRLRTEGPSLEIMEAFFGGTPRLIADLVPCFPNLVTLCLIGQRDLSVIENISGLVKLEELWIAECSITKITGISGLRRLVKAYFYGNQIKQIQGLSNLTNLQILWLNTNSITSIQGLENLCRLVELNIAENKISSIGHSLDHCSNLETLEISGNQLNSFKDITALSRLPNLRKLGFKDPLYIRNPMCLLCNYTTHVLYHLPDLHRLDGHDIANKSYKALAESTVLKKKMFYNMRLKVLQKTASTFIRKLTEFRDQCVLKEKGSRLTHLWQVYKQLQMAVDQLYKCPDTPDDAEQLLRQMEAKMSAIQSRVDSWEKKCEEVVAMYDFYKSRAHLTISALTDRLCLELESGGNIKFEIGSPNDLWFSSCYDLIFSRFCAADYRHIGVHGIKIHKITRVYNRMLRCRFDENVSKSKSNFASKSEDAQTRSNSIRHQMEYLFWVWDHELLGGKHQPIRILEEGFLDADSCQKLGKHSAVPLSNCISMCDKARIKHELDNKAKEGRSRHYPYKYGQLVIAKAFVGNNQQISGSKSNVQSESYPGCDSVYRPRISQPFDKFPRPASAKLDQSPLVHDNDNPSKSCDCSSTQAEWFVFDHELVIPEYLVDFEYVTTLKPVNPFEQFDFTVLECPSTFTSTETNLSSDDDVLQMPPVELSHRSERRLEALTAPSLRSYLSVESLEHVTHLNIHNQRVCKLSGIQQMTGLKTLVASFNDLSRVDSLVNMKIQTLDISFNKITTLDGMKNMSCLRTADISWNCMRYIRDEFAIMRKHAPLLENLNTQHNLWLKPLDFRLRVIARMKSLQTLDDIEISESEATAALRLSAGARVSPVHIMSQGRTDQHKPRSLSLGSVAQVLSHSITRSIADRVSDADSNQWMNKITSLCLDNQHLSKLSSLDRLVNLKWASFCHNDIVKLEGLDMCLQLEELYLDDNCIYKLEGLQRLQNLRRLSLSDNYLVQLDASQLDQLSHLHYLALDHNKISSLSSIQRCKGLIELYMSQNRILNGRDVFFLKGCWNLMVLDLSGNPVTGTDNYRLFMIYHLGTLKAFDGTPVENGELTRARELLGGRLTSDFVAERVGHSVFSSITELDVPLLSLRSIDLGNGEAFVNLRSINLEHNNLTHLGGLVHLPNLRVLCLNHNKVECITKLEKTAQSEYSSGRLIPVLESLEVLHLGYNGIRDLSTLQVSRMVNLKALFLQGNALQTVSGLEGLHDLRELVLDKNKIKTITENSFVHLWNLQELHIEENRIRELSHFHYLESLQRLFLGMNRIQDLSEVEKLFPLTQLTELSLVSCPVSRRLMHRPLLVYKMPSLTIIDGIPVAEEEQLKASLYYIQQEQQQQMMNDNNQLLPGINQPLTNVKGQVPVKVTNVSLGNFSDRTPWSGTLQFDPSILATADDRSRKAKVSQASNAPRSQNLHIPSSYPNQLPPGSQQARNGNYGDGMQNSSNPFSRTNRR